MTQAFLAASETRLNFQVGSTRELRVGLRFLGFQVDEITPAVERPLVDERALVR